MSDDIKNQGGHSDYEDDFDDLEFEDIDFDETDIDNAGYEDITDEDLADDDFAADDDWDEEADAAAAPQGRKWGRKEKSLYTDTSERKGLNLSFNTMVIVGALLLGGSVLAYTVMSKTAEVNSGKPSAFQSMLGIGSVFDGQIFGKTADEQNQTAQPDENVTAVENGQPQTGLLDNPDQALAENRADGMSAVDGAPPSPTPISPAEEDDIITPLPGDHVPRGPEEYAESPDMQLEPVPVQPSQPQSADDLLKAAIANRANKDKAQDPVTPAPEVISAPEPEAEPEIIVAEEVPAEPVATPEPAPAVVSSDPAPDTAALEAAQKRASAAEEQINTLQQQITALQARLDQTENELTTARSGQTNASAELQKTVDSLKSELQSANDKASAEAKARLDAEAKAAQARKDAEAAQKQASAKAAEAKKQADAAAAAKKAQQEKEAAAKKAEANATAAAQKPKPPAKAATATSAPRQPSPTPPVAAAATPVQWELRAAQPGRAWVSKLGARDMQSITVGESLPGIGRITSISYMNGRWVVQGTSGQIFQ